MRDKSYGILIGLALNIFVAGVGWGTIWQKVNDIEKRLERIEEHSDRNKRPGTFSQPWSITSAEAAIRDSTTNRGNNSERTPTSFTKPTP